MDGVKVPCSDRCESDGIEIRLRAELFSGRRRGVSRTGFGYFFHAKKTKK
jgi:hypothetical protein